MSRSSGAGSAAVAGLLGRIGEGQGEGSKAEEGAGAAGETPAEGGVIVPETFKVLTFNVNWGYCRNGRAGRRGRFALRRMAEEAADIVVLQESHEGWEQALLDTRSEEGQLFNDVYRPENRLWFHPPGGVDGGAGGSAVLWRDPHRVKVDVLKPRDDGGVEGSFFDLPVATVELFSAEDPQKPLFPGGAALRLANVHLRPSIDEKYHMEHDAGFWKKANFAFRTAGAYLFSAPSVRDLELRHLLAQVDVAGPLMIAGDFNEPESGQGTKALMREEATPSFRSALYDFDGGKTLTWEWPLAYYTLKDRYDHILYNNWMRATEARCLRDVDCSDHFPVVAVFEVATQPQP